MIVVPNRWAGGIETAHGKNDGEGAPIDKDLCSVQSLLYMAQKMEKGLGRCQVLL
jgi:hypothetical protein